MLTKVQCIEKLRNLCFTYDQELLATRSDEKNAELIQRSIVEVLTLVEASHHNMYDTEIYREVTHQSIVDGKLDSAIASAIWSSILISTTNDLLHIEPTLFDKYKLTRQALQSVVRKAHSAHLDMCRLELKDCPSCHVHPGELHKGLCTVERCSVCGQAHYICKCDDNDKIFSKWMGCLPGEYECLLMDLTVVDPKTMKLLPNLDLFMALGLPKVFFVKHDDEPLSQLAERIYHRILERQCNNAESMSATTIED